MSDFENVHPRDREGKFTDKPGTVTTSESDVDLSPQVVGTRVDWVYDEFHAGVETGSDEVIGTAYSNQATWQMPDGTFRRAKMMTFARAHVEVPGHKQDTYEWEGMDLPLDRPLTSREHYVLGAVADRNPGAPTVRYEPVTIAVVSGFTDVTNPRSTELFRHQFDAVPFTDDRFDSFGAAEQAARTYAHDETFDDYRPQYFDPDTLY